MDILDILISDCIVHITKFLTDKDKIRLLSTSKDLDALKNMVTYDELIEIQEVYWLRYYNQFTNIVAHDLMHRFPKSITHLEFGFSFNMDIKDRIPNTVTHLEFGFSFNMDIKDRIPNTVTHLILGLGFNKDIKGCIPNSVTHLTFGWMFNKDIKDCLPNSITHLIFDGMFNRDIKGCIPSSVTHLTFGIHFNQDIKEGYIPKSVIELTIDNRHRRISVHNTCKIIRI